MDGYEIKESRSETIENKQVLITEANKSRYKIRSYSINADNEGIFIVVYTTLSSNYPYQEEFDTILSSFDPSGINDYIAALTPQDEESIPDESADSNNATTMNVTKEQEKDRVDETGKTKETEIQKPAQNSNDGGLTYDDDGYILVTYTNRGKLANIDKPNVHLTGTLVDTNNICFIIEDEKGNLWTGESALGHDFTEYIGTECDIYGFCTDGISNRHNTPLIDMAYKDSNISFEDGRSYYPKDDELSDEFPRWNLKMKERIAPLVCGYLLKVGQSITVMQDAVEWRILNK